MFCLCWSVGVCCGCQLVQRPGHNGLSFVHQKLDDNVNVAPLRSHLVLPATAPEFLVRYSSAAPAAFVQTPRNAFQTRRAKHRARALLCSTHSLCSRSVGLCQVVCGCRQGVLAIKDRQAVENCGSMHDLDVQILAHNERRAGHADHHATPRRMHTQKPQADGFVHRSIPARNLDRRETGELLESRNSLPCRARTKPDSGLQQSGARRKRKSAFPCCRGRCVCSGTSTLSSVRPPALKRNTSRILRVKHLHNTSFCNVAPRQAGASRISQTRLNELYR